MSLFGKLLAVMNLLGAVGLIYLASASYGARQQWAYVVQRYDLMIQGLPVDGSELDRQGLPVVENISDGTIQELFAQVGSSPVRTQIDEVQAVKGRIDSKVRELEADKRQQAFVLASLLLPMADNILERDEYLATQAHLANPATLKALEGRYVSALRDAKREGASGPDRPFHQAFRLGVRSQGGAPSEALTGLIVEQLPRDPKADVNIAKLVADALEAQRVGMLKKLEDQFARAMTNTEQSQSTSADGVKNSNNSQRAAIARLLLGLAVFQADDAIQADANHAERGRFAGQTPATPGWTRALANTDELKRRQRRVFVVSGVQVATNALAMRSATLRLLASQVDAAAADERILFLSDDAALLDEARDLADRLHFERAAITENVRKIGLQRGTVKLRGTDVTNAEAELKQATEDTDKAIASLRTETEKARAARIQARDRLLQLADREKTIADLERQVQDAEAKGKAR